MIRFCDIALSLSALIVLSPILLLTMLMLKFTGEGEVFYLQSRVGKNKKMFNLFKFATMLKNSPRMGSGTLTIQNDPRVLPFGRFLRKTKINELPQLVNVLLGDMSLIGPRPLTSNMFEFYSPDIQVVIASVRPGLSGMGSVIFRDEERLLKGEIEPMTLYSTVIAPYKGELEKWFVGNKSFFLYCKLILSTLLVIGIPNSNTINYLFRDLPSPCEELVRLMSTSEL